MLAYQQVLLLLLLLEKQLQLLVLTVEIINDVAFQRVDIHRLSEMLLLLHLLDLRQQTCYDAVLYAVPFTMAQLPRLKIKHFHRHGRICRDGFIPLHTRLSKLRHL